MTKFQSDIFTDSISVCDAMYEYFKFETFLSHLENSTVFKAFILKCNAT